MAATAIERQLQKCGYKTDSDVCELYLGRKGLEEVTELSRFRMLKYLWLNHNKITRVTFLTNNYRLSELYLNNNEIGDITGLLKHLTSLHTLLLNNNQLAKLQATVKELKAMTNLRILSLYHNPLAQDSVYRFYVIFHLPSVQHLDLKCVKQREREDAFKLFNHERTAVMQSLGFGRRTDSVVASRRPCVPHSTENRSSISSRKHAAGHNIDRMHFFGVEDAVLLRNSQRSVMQFSVLDWNKIPSSQQKRIDHQPFDPPQLKTFLFR
ncbi:leucine-rich repeat-containing protein 72 [Bombina bombina]|uniref:leucine-rich repeat-containing protein 72 n=1 Tax=Bombina bombina TaxID=8345 RepID=UPI00235A88FF|nr:leucine-rich repeat-containing protein 72 [Bombina bombina]